MTAAIGQAVFWAAGELFKFRDRVLLDRAVARGLQLGDNVQIFGAPHFGSEPYLISIGNNVTIAGGVRFHTHDGMAFHLRKLGLTGHIPKYGRITIHDDSGIGEGTLILPGVTIGPRSLVGAGSVVRKDVPPNTVVFGNPARFAMTVDDLVESFKRREGELDLEAYARDPMGEVLKRNPRPW